MDCIEKRQLPLSREEATGPIHRALEQNLNHLRLIDGVLYRETVIGLQPRKQLVLPSNYVPRVLQMLNTDVGHPGRDRTLHLLGDRFYWRGMSGDVDSYIKTCPQCLR